MQRRAETFQDHRTSLRVVFVDIDVRVSPAGEQRTQLVVEGRSADRADGKEDLQHGRPSVRHHAVATNAADAPGNGSSTRRRHLDSRSATRLRKRRRSSAARAHRATVRAPASDPTARTHRRASSFRRGTARAWLRPARCRSPDAPGRRGRRPPRRTAPSRSRRRTRATSRCSPGSGSSGRSRRSASRPP